MKGDDASDEGKLMIYCIERATVLAQLECKEVLELVRDSILPLYVNCEEADASGKPELLQKVSEEEWISFVFYKKMLADYFRYLAEAEGQGPE